MTHYCLKWHSHIPNMLELLKDMYMKQTFVDVTMYCEKSQILAHRLVLSACSPFFRKILQETTNPNPIIIMSTMQLHVMKAILDFMYNGEVTVHCDVLEDLLEGANTLDIKGLIAVCQKQLDLKKQTLDSLNVQFYKTEKKTDAEVESLCPVILHDIPDPNQFQPNDVMTVSNNNFTETVQEDIVLQDSESTETIPCHLFDTSGLTRQDAVVPISYSPSIGFNSHTVPHTDKDTAFVSNLKGRTNANNQSQPIQITNICSLNEPQAKKPCLELHDSEASLPIEVSSEEEEIENTERTLISDFKKAESTSVIHPEEQEEILKMKKKPRQIVEIDLNKLDRLNIDLAFIKKTQASDPAVIQNKHSIPRIAAYWKYFTQVTQSHVICNICDMKCKRHNLARHLNRHHPNVKWDTTKPQAKNPCPEIHDSEASLSIEVSSSEEEVESTERTLVPDSKKVENTSVIHPKEQEEILKLEKSPRQNEPPQAKKPCLEIHDSEALLPTEVSSSEEEVEILKLDKRPRKIVEIDLNKLNSLNIDLAFIKKTQESGPAVIQSKHRSSRSTAYWNYFTQVKQSKSQAICNICHIQCSIPYLAHHLNRHHPNLKWDTTKESTSGTTSSKSSHPPVSTRI